MMIQEKESNGQETTIDNDINNNNSSEARRKVKQKTDSQNLFSKLTNVSFFCRRFLTILKVSAQVQVPLGHGVCNTLPDQE